MEHAFTFHNGNYTVRTYCGAVLIIALSHLYSMVEYPSISICHVLYIVNCLCATCSYLHEAAYVDRVKAQSCMGGLM